MAPDMESIAGKIENLAFPPNPHKGIPEAGETGLLLKAFEMFTKASSSLESAFSQLQAKAQKLTDRRTYTCCRLARQAGDRPAS